MPNLRNMGSALCLSALLGLMSSPTPAQAVARIVEVILDCSGRMKRRLPSGETRIDAAKQAVAAIVPRLPGQTLLALRAYSHQSPTARHDCKDTKLLADFAPTAQHGARLVEKAQALPAQGYTPVTRVLGLAV